jgi:centromere protein I
LEEIETVDEFINKLEKIQLPNQLVAAIGDPLLQKLLLLNPEPSTFQRIDLWLLAFFEQQLENLGSEKAIIEMLEAIRVYTSHTKVSSAHLPCSLINPNKAQRLPPSCLKYLQSMIDSWNGIAGRQVILDLLAYTALTPWQGMYHTMP